MPVASENEPVIFLPQSEFTDPWNPLTFQVGPWLYKTKTNSWLARLGGLKVEFISFWISSVSAI